MSSVQDYLQHRFVFFSIYFFEYLKIFGIVSISTLVNVFTYCLLPLTVVDMLTRSDPLSYSPLLAC